MKSLLITIFCLTITVAAFAQNANDVVYLKDGSLFRGTVTEKVAGSHVSLLLPNGETKRFDLNEVDKISMVGVKEPFEFKPVGYMGTFSTGLMIGSNYYGPEVRPSFQMTHGVNIGNRWMVSLGTGIEAIQNDWNVPVFAEGRYHFGTGRIQPYLGAQAGYNIPISGGQVYYWDIYPAPTEKLHGGPMATAEIGVRNVVKKHFGYNVSLGYRFQQDYRDGVRYNYNGTTYVPVPTVERTTMQRFLIRFGFIFN